ncbi:MAG: hypothetical protein AAF970_06910 [Bacteroidota bacterium]
MKPVPLTTHEIELVAEQMAESYNKRVAYVLRDDSHEDHTGLLNGFTGQAERTLNKPAMQVNWFDFDVVRSQLGPEAAQQLWERIRSEAHAALEAGASISPADHEESPWMQAARLAARERFVADWQPAGAVEASLLDILAQTLVQWQFWQGLEMKWGGLHDSYRWSEEPEPHSGPRMDYAEACRHAANMAERAHRQLTRTIRAMRDLRRFAGSITIQNRGQVNIGAQQQVNNQQQG